MEVGLQGVFAEPDKRCSNEHSAAEGEAFGR